MQLSKNQRRAFMRRRGMPRRDQTDPELDAGA